MEARDSSAAGPAVYNLFPRLAGPIDRWHQHFDRAAAMGFDWLYVNPVFYPGFSGSLYAVKDHRRLDPVIVPAGGSDALQALADTLEGARRAGLRPMVDLVINHTAKDSGLVETHPEWYRRDESGRVMSPSAIDPADARKKTVWGDLAELDFEETSDRAGLVELVATMAADLVDVGFEGFRCDAAYKVPAEVWRAVVGAARAKQPRTLFVAETLGCRIEEMHALEGAGFDFVMSSSKYWAFDAPWCLEQHADWQRIAPAVSFPETHDTPRLAAETGGLEQVQKQRLAFAAWFSAGLLMPVGYELGFRKRLDVVKTRPDDWEEPLFDIQPFVRDVLAIKHEHAPLRRDGQVVALTPLDRPTLLLEKLHGDDRLLLAINKDWHQGHSLDVAPFLEGSAAPTAHRPFHGTSDAESLGSPTIELEPAEVALIRP